MSCTLYDLHKAIMDYNYYMEKFMSEKPDAATHSFAKLADASDKLLHISQVLGEEIEFRQETYCIQYQNHQDCFERLISLPKAYLKYPMIKCFADAEDE